MAAAAADRDEAVRRAEMWRNNEKRQLKWDIRCRGEKFEACDKERHDTERIAHPKVLG